MESRGPAGSFALAEPVPPLRRTHWRGCSRWLSLQMPTPPALLRAPAAREAQGGIALVTFDLDDCLWDSVDVMTRAEEARQKVPTASASVSASVSVSVSVSTSASGSGSHTGPTLLCSCWRRAFLASLRDGTGGPSVAR